MTPDLFAAIFCEDLNIPLAPYQEQIASSIKTQVEEFASVAEIPIVSEEQEQEYADADLRVIVNVRPYCPACCTYALLIILL